MKLQLAEGKLKEDNDNLTDKVENLEKVLRDLMKKEQQESEVYWVHCSTCILYN